MSTATEPSARSTGAGPRSGRTSASTSESPLVPALFTATIFLSATLLFSVQPMVARMVLPALGGTPAVWTTCMLFFQAMLLAGYAYAHLAATRLSPRAQAVAQAIVVGSPLLCLPIGLGLTAPGDDQNPVIWLQATLLRGVGLPFFAVATTAPLLQRWFARTGLARASDPYFLYAASNVGSLVALLSYPVLLEPLAPLSLQTSFWTMGYIGLCVLTLGCASTIPHRSPSQHDARVHASVGSERVSWRTWWGWVGLAFIPSSWMLGVTAYVTSDVGAVPLLWVIPLGLYLLSFVAVFARPPWVTTRVSGTFAAGLVALVVWALTVGVAPGPWQLASHLGAFFAGALVCHGTLVERRPSVEHLTTFYLATSVGGVLGGVFNAIVAPLVFDRYVEYPLILALSLLALPRLTTRTTGSREWRRVGAIAVLAGGLALGSILITTSFMSGRSAAILVELSVGLAVVLVFAKSWGNPPGLALGVVAVLLVGAWPRAGEGRVSLRDRSFFGAVKVDDDAEGRFRRLVHGTTIHGRQSLEPERRREPLAYYHRTGPAGDVFGALAKRTQAARVGVVGLGAGALAAYARSGERWTFYEIDPAVVRVARDPAYFTYLSDCRSGPPELLLGDARRRLREAEPGSYDLIVLDAFSSDAIPIHLLTREALALDRSKLSPGGRIAVHVSNRYLNLGPALSALAADAGWVCRIREDLEITREADRAGKSASVWAVLAARVEDLGPMANDSRWRTPPPRPANRAWTDDHSDLIRSLARGGATGH
ncbi:MAG: fused MFS/spermidine synthase [Isosphaeraceae bacterium]